MKGLVRETWAGGGDIDWGGDGDGGNSLLLRQLRLTPLPDCMWLNIVTSIK